LLIPSGVTGKSGCAEATENTLLSSLASAMKGEKTGPVITRAADRQMI
jgi:hypothetical protein